MNVVWLVQKACRCRTRWWRRRASCTTRRCSATRDSAPPRAIRPPRPRPPHPRPHPRPPRPHPRLRTSWPPNWRYMSHVSEVTPTLFKNRDTNFQLIEYLCSLKCQSIVYLLIDNIDIQFYWYCLLSINQALKSTITFVAFCKSICFYHLLARRYMHAHECVLH